MGSKTSGRRRREEADTRLSLPSSRSSGRATRGWPIGWSSTPPDTLAVYSLSDREARRWLVTTNSIEHDHAEARRRTSVIRVFPNEASVLRLASALAAERNKQWLVRRCVGVAVDNRPAGEAADAA